ncbi:Cysteine--tRNA ligase [Mycoplasmopsis californica]|uniref:Cysteine--tRNA ligase n=1 Tax=Mycoplasmopsis equigenitalium TaxID=114883 RepID=A0ABY5J3U5_9BACT|nr:cysteine--tRNA ligase [Mycoplasmopsis equigenitalium]UUD36817.1 cysteine--tRNA ligase [Mycoplasmopsis equigenitalium]VEU69886.1 Cysteine--tRNA ligase [Mycoplasmopsis californica]
MKKIYVCGPTVYSNVHIGNLRPIISFDFVLKAYQYLDIEYEFVHNITDIDDKIINRAIEENTTEEKISKKYAFSYLKLLKKLHISTITKIEKVTRNMDVLIDFIRNLVYNGFAYQVADGVLYNTALNKTYGSLSNVKAEFMKENEEASEFKTNPQDFYLWKNTTKGIKYQSPWGKGRPGWHTECCALVYKNFGPESIDIHGGGIDLIFPHHENENAQFYSLFKQNLAKEWKYSGQININKVKMSKSLGNIITAADFIKKYGADFFRIFILNHNFSSEINVSDETIKNAEAMLKKYKRVYHKFAIKKPDALNEDKVKKVMEYLANFDFHHALFEIDNLIKDVNKNIEVDENISSLAKIFDVLKFDFIENHFKENIEEIYWNYQEKIKNKDFKRADKIREKLLEKGWI